MSAIDGKGPGAQKTPHRAESPRAEGPRAEGPRAEGPRADDPRVLRTRAAVIDAARVLFLRHGYAGTTMEDIAAQAGLTKRTLYNNYPDKEALFVQIVIEVSNFAAEFARGLHREFNTGFSPANVEAKLYDLGQRLALSIVRDEVIALRRLLIGEARAFPELAREYFDRAPGQVIEALTIGFAHLGHQGILSVTDARTAAGQFAYLVAGEALDHAMLAGTTPTVEFVTARAQEGVRTFLARYAVPKSRGKKASHA